MNSNITISIKDFCDAMRRSFEKERDMLADRKELELQAKASGINVSAAKKWLKAEVFDDGAQNPKRVARLIEQTVDQVVYGESLGYDLGMFQNNEARPHVEVRNGSNKATKTPEATVKGEADGIARGPRTASPTESLVGQSGLTSPVPDLDTSFAGTEGDADRQPNSKSAAAQDAGLASTVAAAMATEIGRKALTTAIDVMIERLDESENNSIPATSSPPETGGDAASSSLASSPTNSDGFDPVIARHMRAEAN